MQMVVCLCGAVMNWRLVSESPWQLGQTSAESGDTELRNKQILKMDGWNKWNTAWAALRALQVVGSIPTHSLCSSPVLPLSAWVLCCFFGLLPQSREAAMRIIGNCQFSNVTANGCLSLCVSWPFEGGLNLRQRGISARDPGSRMSCGGKWIHEWQYSKLSARYWQTDSRLTHTKAQLWAAHFVFWILVFLCFAGWSIQNKQHRVEVKGYDAPPCPSASFGSRCQTLCIPALLKSA